MNIFVLDSKSYGIDGICSALTALGHTCTVCRCFLNGIREDKAIEASLKEAILADSFDAVFSFNYFPLLSNVCNTLNIRYISWIYDSPLVALYSASVLNPCNFIFTFDREQHKEFYNGGITNIYYMPLAANMSYYNSLNYSEHVLSSDICFVGSLYNEEHTLYDKLSGINDYTRGYLDALLAMQEQLYQKNVLQENLTKPVIDELMRVCPYKANKDGIETPAYIYANYFLPRRLAQTGRSAILGRLSEHFNVTLYTHYNTPGLPAVINKGPADYVTEMPYIFHHAKINLNMTLRSIKTGIPLRAFDIMGCGGFLLTNYQAEFFDYFEPGTDFAYYTDTDDLVETAAYYLEHEDKRQQIAASGLQKIKAFHTFEARLNDIFSIVFN